MLVIVAALLWSSSGLFAKSPWFDSWPAQTRGLGLAFWRSVCVVIVILPLVRRPRWRPAMLPMMACFAVMTWSFLSAMVWGSDANAIWLQFLAPAWIVLLSAAGLGPRPNRRDLWMLMFALVGVGWILAFELSGTGTAAVAAGLLSGVMLAGVMLCYRHLREEDGAWLGVLNCLGTAVLLAPWAIVEIPLPRGEQWPALFAFGFFQLGLPYLIFARGLHSTPAQEASFLSLIEPICLPVWTYLAWNGHPTYQPPAWWTWVGAATILVGLTLRYLPIRRWRIRKGVRSQ